MTSPSAPVGEFFDLMCDLTENRLSPRQAGRLNELLHVDPANPGRYVNFMLVVTGLRWMTESACDLRSSPPPPALFPRFPGVLQSTVGYSSGWPVAYSIATVMTGLLILGFWLMPVSRPEQVARQSDSLPSPLSPLPSVVGRITGMVDCRWAEKVAGAENPPSTIHHPTSLVSLGDQFTLASGLMEITYNTGAKVILQGPVTYQAESNGGYLAVGKLTGKLGERGEGRGERAAKVVSGQLSVSSPQPLAPSPSSNPQSLIPNAFVIRTPTATVTDLGTEFGVEVSSEGVTETQVLVGAVKIAASGEQSDGGIEQIVHAGSAVRVDRRGNQLTALQPIEGRFARVLPPRAEDARAAAYADMVLSMKPLAYYRMERPKDRRDRLVVLDSAPGGHHGTLHFSDELFGEPWEAGRFGSSLLLRGPMAGDYVDVPDFPIADANQLSLSAWVYSWSIERDCIIAGEMVPFPLKKNDTWQFVAELHPYYNLIGDVNPRNKGYATAMEGDTKPFPRAQWQHVAFVADGAILHVYHNGVETASAPCDGVAPAPSPKHFSIGAIWAWNQGATAADAKPVSFFSGRIDEVAVFNRALSAQEIQQLFQGKASRGNGTTK